MIDINKQIVYSIDMNKIILRKIEIQEAKLEMARRAVNVGLCPNDGQNLVLSYDEREGDASCKCTTCNFKHNYGTTIYHGLF